MPESIGQPFGGVGSGVSAVSPGSGASGFSSRALVFGAPNGSLTNNSSAPHWDSTNNFLGIGTTNPEAKLQLGSSVGGGIPGTDIARFVNAGAVTAFALSATGGGFIDRLNFSGGSKNLVGDISGAGSIGLQTAALERLHVTTAGNVGIGTTGPLGLLHVNGSVILGGSTVHAVGFYGSTGTTQPSTYTTAAITTARVFPSTASISTGTGVGGAPFGFTSRADMEALVRVVDSIYRDLSALGLLR